MNPGVKPNFYFSLLEGIGHSDELSHGGEQGYILGGFMLITIISVSPMFTAEFNSLANVLGGMEELKERTSQEKTLHHYHISILT